MTDSIDWNRDPAASGWRSRAFLEDGWQLIAYDDGRWEIRHGVVDGLAGGRESDGEHAKARAVLVHRALTQELA